MTSGVVGALLFQFTWVPRISTILLESQAREIRREIRILSDGLVPFLLSGQLGAIHETLERVEDRHDNWIAVTLERPGGRRLYPFTEQQVETGPDHVTEEISINFRGEELGTISARVDLGPELTRLRAEQGRLALAGAGFILLVMSLVAYLVDRLVSRRLAQVAHAADEMALGDFGVALPEGNDEVGQLAKSFAAMRDRIREQTETLEKSRIRAEDALEARARFVATMSHEIRTPLNGVIPVARMLAQSSLDEHQRGQVETIHKSGKALLSIVNDILDASKMDGGHLKLRRLPFSLENLFEDAASIVRFSARAKGIGLGQEFDAPTGLACLGDEDRLRQVLINILGNAVKFTETGSVSFAARARPLTEDRFHLEFEISDTGVGIPKEAQERIFDRFEQVDDSTSRRFGGTGLGLAIAGDLIRAMGGDITVTSKVGVGSTFRVTVDLDRAVAAPGSPPEPATAGDQTGKGRSVLVADDNAINRQVAAAMLTKFGCAVVTAENGRSAVMHARSHRFDVILMDLNMPEMDGLEATRRIREGNGPNVATKIVALTASVQDSDMDRCRTAGMDGFLSKPLLEADLAEAVAA